MNRQKKNRTHGEIREKVHGAMKAREFAEKERHEKDQFEVHVRAAQKRAEERGHALPA